MIQYKEEEARTTELDGAQSVKDTTKSLIDGVNVAVQLHLMPWRTHHESKAAIIDE